ncbi:hypothetical protein [Roseburia sp. AF42-8]|uniref:hypothetical protein n=1 Tax=Roseburia sp. AF42-8 TaxID=2293137 RepID=UPI0011C17B10|nr:hypothetical protein [Roseburia sp. AF42-8]
MAQEVPIPLGHNPKRRKLVLSFFVDGLAQEVINGPDFEKLMPNTYRFLKKVQYVQMHLVVQNGLSQAWQLMKVD